MRIVIDTNCLLASIPPKSSYYWLYKAFEDEQFVWVVSNEILLEYEEQLTKKYSPKTAQLILSILGVADNTLFSEPFFHWNLMTNDPEDNKFVDLAIATGANYLVTNDAHFNILKNIEFPSVKVVSIQAFKTILESFQ